MVVLVVSNLVLNAIDKVMHKKFENSFKIWFAIELDVRGRQLLDGDIAVWDLIITKHLSKPLDKYKQRVGQVIAAEQLVREGAEVHAGKNIRFLLTSVDNKRYERRVKAEELIEKNTNPDIKKYLLLLYASAANILSPLSYTAKDVYDSTRGYQQTALIQSYEK